MSVFSSCCEICEVRVLSFAGPCHVVFMPGPASVLHELSVLFAAGVKLELPLCMAIPLA